jgi:hypothetical protein
MRSMPPPMQLAGSGVSPVAHGAVAFRSNVVHTRSEQQLCGAGAEKCAYPAVPHQCSDPQRDGLRGRYWFRCIQSRNRSSHAVSCTDSSYEDADYDLEQLLQT